MRHIMLEKTQYILFFSLRRMQGWKTKARKMGAHRKSPIDSTMQKSTTLKFLLDLDSKYNSSAQPHKHSEYEEILSLISYCSYTHMFDDPSESPSQHNFKQDKLLGLLSTLKSSKKSVPDEILPPLFAMISYNLFRPLPPPTAGFIISIFPDDDDLLATTTAGWPLLSIVYDILLHLVLKLEPKTLSEYIDHRFILNLLALFQSEDPRERESLKNVFHKIYAKFHCLRSFMRKAMNDVFLYHIYETEKKHCGIGDLLEIWGSIVNGFSVPLKEEHKLFLRKVLIPLHRPKGMQSYHKQLAYCVYQLVEKEPMIGIVVVKGILRHWPATNCPKEVLLIGEIEELVEIMGPDQHKILALPLCAQITKCLNSWSSQVAERALYVWNNELFVKMASEAIEDVFPVVVEGMEKNLQRHWSRSVRQLTENVKEMLVELEPELYSKCLSELDRRDSKANEEERKRQERWEKVEMIAAKMNEFVR